jgi:AcrR family transcriptional regulator
MKIVISKEAEVRKKEIIQAAMELFREKGYGKTTIADINKRVGVTKGAFYYHFSSKEDLLEQVAAGLSEKTIAITREICALPGLNAVEKMNAVTEKVYAHRIKNIKEYTEVYTFTRGENNLILGKRIWERVFNAVKDSYVTLLHQGIGEGLFTIDFPEEVYEVIMIVSDFYRKTLAALFFQSRDLPGNKEIMKRKAAFLQKTMENLLGVQTGSLRVAEQILKPYQITP